MIKTKIKDDKTIFTNRKITKLSQGLFSFGTLRIQIVNQAIFDKVAQASFLGTGNKLGKGNTHKHEADEK